jgi:hypothetical protein
MGRRLAGLHQPRRLQRSERDWTTDFAGKVDEAEALPAMVSKHNIAASSTWKIRLQRRLIESARPTSSVRHLFSIGRGSSCSSHSKSTQF